MPRSKDSKRTKKVKELRKQFDVSLEASWLIDCSETLPAKALAVAVWTLAAGNTGVTACDLAIATGLTKQVCVNALDDLVDDELAIKNSDKFVSSLVDSNSSSDSSNEEDAISHARVSSLLSSPLKLSKDLIGTKSLLLVPMQKSGSLKKENCSKKDNEIMGSETEPMTSSSATCCATNLETKNKEDSGQNKRKHPTAEPLKIKKIKLKELRSPRKRFRDDLISKTSKPNGVNAAIRENYKQNPSTHPDLNNWSQRSNPNNWRKLDWVGYWLHKFRLRYEVEDPHFVGLTVYRSMKRATQRNKGKPDAYWYAALQIEKMGDSDRGFNGDWKELKEYIDWLLDQYVVESHWLDGPVTAKQIFRVTNNHFLEKFKVRNVKAKGLKKGKGKRHHWGFDPNG